MMGRDEVYVALLGEGTSAWRPVMAEQVAPKVFRLIGPVPDDEVWQFQPDDVVHCEPHRFSGGDETLVAVSKVSV